MKFKDYCVDCDFLNPKFFEQNFFTFKDFKKNLNSSINLKGPSSVRRSLAAGKVRSPSRPVVFSSLNKPPVIPSVLENKGINSCLQKNVDFVVNKIKDHHERLSKKYNSTLATMIISAALIGSLFPIPGATLFSCLPFLGLAEAMNFLKKNPKMLKKIDLFYSADKQDVEKDAIQIDVL
jgi:hypothetical protein